MFIKFCGTEKGKKKILFHCESSTALWDESTVDHKPGIIYPALFALQIIIPTFQEYKFVTLYIQQNQENIQNTNSIKKVLRFHLLKKVLKKEDCNLVEFLSFAFSYVYKYELKLHFE